MTPETAANVEEYLEHPRCGEAAGSRSPTKTPSEAVIQSVLEAYGRGQTSDALKRATAVASLKNWAGGGCWQSMRIEQRSFSATMASKFEYQQRGAV
jgi:hypothetical protein